MLKQIAIYFLIALVLNGNAQCLKRFLHSQWNMFNNDSSIFIKCINIPAEVHAVLAEHHYIDHPFKNSTVDSVQNIGATNWNFSTTFEINESELKSNKILFFAECLDTYAEVILNGVTICSATNFFRTWTSSVKPYLHLGKNTLLLKFYAPANVLQKTLGQKPNLPEGERSWIRKPAYQFGWDWAPKLITQGPQGVLGLQFIHKAILENISLHTDTLINTNAILHSHFKLTTETDSVFQLNFKITDAQASCVFDTIFKAQAGDIDFSFQIKNPKLWWPTGLGLPNMYKAFITLKTDTKIQDYQVFHFGIRKVQWIQDFDSVGQTFFLKINGKPCFARGANIVPPHSIYSKANDTLYRYMVKAAKSLNMNMLRVWGGGFYMPDCFYQACDSNGIMVWHDFMFANAMYPSDSSFLLDVEQELKQQIQRISLHPSLVLWCGNNEIDEAWNNWSWSKQMHYNAIDSAQIYNTYRKLFHKKIPEILATLKTGIFYHPSSPQYGWGHKESFLFGDSHYWGVWWGQQAFSSYRKHIPRFSSEFGFQGMPNFSLWNNWLNSTQHFYSSSLLRSYQKHPQGFLWISKYLNWYLPMDTSLKRFTYLTQILQRDGVLEAVYAQRFAQPYCMGSLIWQLNDCWPSVSWSIYDFTLKPKALAYGLKNAWDDVAIDIYADSLQQLILKTHCWYSPLQHAKLNVECKTFNNDIVFKMNYTITTKASEIYSCTIRPGYKTTCDSANTYLKATVKYQGKSYTQFYFFKPPKQLKLKPDDIKIRYINQNTIEVYSKNFCKDLYLYDDLNVLQFDQNYITLEPGCTKKINLRASSKFKIEQIRYISLNSILQNSHHEDP